MTHFTGAAAGPGPAAASQRIKIRLNRGSLIKGTDGKRKDHSAAGNPQATHEFWAEAKLDALGKWIPSSMIPTNINGTMVSVPHWKVYNNEFDTTEAGYINERNADRTQGGGSHHHKNKKSLKSKKILHSKKKKKLKKKKTKRKINLSDISQYRFSMSSSNGPLRKRSKRKKRSKKKHSKKKRSKRK